MTSPRPAEPAASPAPASLSRRRAIGMVGAGAVAGAIAPRAALAQDPAPTAPAPTMPPTAIYRFSIGEIEAISISDGTTSMPAPLQPMWAPEAKPEEFAAALAHGFLPADRMLLSFNVLVLRRGPETVLIDAGFGTGAAPALGRLTAGLRAVGIDPDAVTTIVISHAHGDHYGGLQAKDGVVPFPKARLVIHTAEHGFWTGPTPDLSKNGMDDASRTRMIKGVQEFFATQPRPVLKAAPGDKVLPWLELVDASGHTPGHLALLIGDGAERLLHIADCAHNHVLMFKHPEWTVGFDTDPAAARVARRRIFDRAAADRTRVFGYHMPFPGLGHIRAEGASFEWVPEPWEVGS